MWVDGTLACIQVSFLSVVVRPLFVGRCSLFLSMTFISSCQALKLCLLVCWTDHEDDYVIELANEVRRVLEMVKEAASTEKSLVAAPQVAAKEIIPSLQLRPRQEAVAMDS